MIAEAQPLIYQPLSPTERERLNTAPLWEVAKDDHPDRYNHPRRIRQEMDKETDEKRREWYNSEAYQIEHPYGPLQPVTIDELWQAFGMKETFPQQSWEFFQNFKGTKAMYADPEHKTCIHGEDHQGGRVPDFAYVLSTYAGLDASEMKNVMIAANVHDMARRDDRIAPNHGKEAAYNFTHTALYMNQDKYEVHFVQPHVETFTKRGFIFTESDIEQIKAMCIYHEVPWNNVPDEYKTEDTRTGLLIQIMQAADAADRFRSPSTRWWPEDASLSDRFG